MAYTTFKNKSNNLNSIRFGTSNYKSSLYTNDFKVHGLTAGCGNITQRMNSSGQCISTGIKMGNYTTYLGCHGNVMTHIAPLK